MTQPALPQGPLAGVRVLDLSRVLAGPWCGQLLGDLGADVIKVERPVEGDDTRHWGPPFLTTPDGAQGDAAYYLSANRNKRSITVNFGHPEGRALIERLADDSDILLENYKTGGLAKFGLDYPTLSERNRRLVYCSITGFGHTGPYARRAGYDYLIQAMSGLMSVTGQPSGTPGDEPMKVGVAVADLVTGLYSASAILAALHHARATGQGQFIDMALLDCQLAVMSNQATNYLASGVAPVRLGNAHPNIAPYQVFATLDGHIVVAVGNDQQFKHYCEAIGAAHLAHDPEFVTNQARVTHRGRLNACLEPIMAERASSDWLAALEAANVPCGPINTFDQVFADPQVQERGMLAEATRPDGVVTRAPACPIKMSETPVRAPSAPPALGAHTKEVLQERLGLSAQEVARLSSEGAI